jgi:hypothetical protein
LFQKYFFSKRLHLSNFNQAIEATQTLSLIIDRCCQKLVKHPRNLTAPAYKLWHLEYETFVSYGSTLATLLLESA